MNNNFNEQPVKPKKKLKVWQIVLIVFGIFVLLGILGSCLGGKDKKDSNTPALSSQTESAPSEEPSAAAEPSEAEESSSASKEESTVEESSKVSEEAKSSAESSPEPSKAEESKVESKSESSTEMINGMRKSFKDAMDSYEAFFDEYVDFMDKYSKSDNTAVLLTEYLDFMAKYADYMKKLDDWGDEDMNDIETAYYLEVMNRINTKLIGVAVAPSSDSTDSSSAEQTSNSLSDMLNGLT